MHDLVVKLQSNYPALSFIQADDFRWSPHTKTISYAVTTEATNPWSLLHEVGHALLEHQAYKSDVELLHKEVAAWHEAIKLAADYHITIDGDFVEDCLDTYRDWLHKRSTCPQCGMQGFQKSIKQYNCLNCRQVWTVTSARFCRPYRRTN